MSRNPGDRCLALNRPPHPAQGLTRFRAIFIFLKDVDLKAKARISPWLSYMIHIRSTAVCLALCRPLHPAQGLLSLSLSLTISLSLSLFLSQPGRFLMRARPVFRNRSKLHMMISQSLVPPLPWLVAVVCGRARPLLVGTRKGRQL